MSALERGLQRGNKLISVSTNSAPPWYTELFYTEIEILCGLLMTKLFCSPTISNLCVCNGFKSFSTKFLWKCLPWLPGWGSYIIFNGKVGGIKDKHASTDWILITLLFLFSSWLYYSLKTDNSDRQRQQYVCLSEWFVSSSLAPVVVTI